MEFVVHLLIVLVAARILGRLASHMGQPASVGEIFAGVVLVVTVALLPAGVPYLSTLVDSPAIHLVGKAGIFFLLLYAGVEMEPAEIARHSKESFAVATGGMILPLMLGLALAWAILPESDIKQAQALVVGVGLAVTAIPVAAKVFLEFGLLHEPIGETVISAAVFDDVFALILLAVATSLISTGHVPDLATFALMLAKLASFFALTVAMGIYGYPRLWRWVAAVPIPGIGLGALMAIALSYGLLAEALDMHFVLGPFMAGLFFEPSRVGEETYGRIKRIIDAVTLGLLAPVFFASIGLRLDLRAVTAIPGIVAALIVMAFVGKLFGAGLPAYWAGFDRRSALAIGVGMSGRGAIELIVVSIAQKAGVFAAGDAADPIVGNLFSALVLTAVVTTLMTPLLLRRILAPK